MNQSPSDRFLLLLVRLGAFLCFAGWTWVHLYWEGPYGILIWHDATYEFAAQMGITWDEFVGTGADDGFVQRWLGRVGWLYLACTIMTLTIRKGSWLQSVGLVGGCGLLAILSYAKYVASQYQLPMLVEHGGQVLMPLVLVLAVQFGVRHRATIVTAAIAFITTFAGHGCYALDLWPTPSVFYAMTSVILGVEYETGVTLLRIAGTLDLVVCVGILIPIIRRLCAIYAACWGLLTAIARPAAGMSLGLNYYGADQYLHEAVLRAPHLLIPLYLFFLWRTPKEQSQTLPQTNLVEAEAGSAMPSTA